jgi:hypothetical protein
MIVWRARAGDPDGSGVSSSDLRRPADRRQSVQMTTESRRPGSVLRRRRRNHLSKRIDRYRRDIPKRAPIHFDLLAVNRFLMRSSCRRRHKLRASIESTASGAARFSGRAPEECTTCT